MSETEYSDISKRPVTCLQMEFGCHHVHAAGGFSALLAQKTDADAADDFSRKLRLLLSRVGGPLRHS